MKTNETQPKWVKADIDGNGEQQQQEETMCYAIYQLQGPIYGVGLTEAEALEVL